VGPYNRFTYLLERNGEGKRESEKKNRQEWGMTSGTH